MLRILFVIFLCSVGGLIISLPSMAYYETSRTDPGFTLDGTLPPTISARAWGVFDAETGQLIFGRDVHNALPIASVTKLMTARVATDNVPLDATTTISRRAVATEGRAGELKAGEVMSLRELLFPLLLPSSNDAAEAIAEYAGRDAFIERMNEAAQELGMTDTHYADPSGLSPQNISSVTDLAALMWHLAQTEQYLLDISRLKTYIGTAHVWHNANKISLLDTFRSGKHGYTDEANRTLAAHFDEELARGGTRTLTIILLGSDNLAQDITALQAYLRAHVAYEQGSAPFVIMRESSLWNLLTLPSIANTAQALSPIYAVKNRL